MAKFMAILLDSYLEIKARKFFWVYWAVTIVMILVFAFLPNLEIDGRNLLKSGDIPPEVVAMAVANFFNGFFGFMIFLMVFGSAGMIPAFVSKGRIELSLSKPIGRIKLMLMKFFSVYIIMSLIFMVACGLIFAVMSFQAETYTTYFFYGLGLELVRFFIVYAILFFLGIAFKSTAASIMGYFTIWFVTGLLAGREVVYQILTSKIWKTILDTIYNILPKFSDLSDDLISVLQGQGIADYYPLWSSLLFGIVALLLGLLIFNRRDY
ncbi:MAG: ABC transporter permease subunit [Candidatus Zixiibacteriota bacterium]